MPARQATPFGALLRSWRGARKLSQLDLATEAGVSARHLSFLENGRARPSREMVLLLAEVMAVPLREQNALLQAAGFAAAYGETDLDAPEMAAVRASIRFLLDRHEPYPAVLLDRHWNVVMTNRGGTALLSGFVLSPAALQPPVNVMRLLFRPDGARSFIVNWDELAAAMIQRLHREAALAARDDRAHALLAEALAADVPADWRTPRLGADQPVLVPMRLARDGLEVALFSAITTLGTPLDVTLQELRLETFFPADDESEAALRALVR